MMRYSSYLGVTGGDEQLTCNQSSVVDGYITNDSNP